MLYFRITFPCFFVVLNSSNALLLSPMHSIGSHNDVVLKVETSNGVTVAISDVNGAERIRVQSAQAARIKKNRSKANAKPKKLMTKEKPTSPKPTCVPLSSSANGSATRRPKPIAAEAIHEPLPSHVQQKRVIRRKPKERTSKSITATLPRHQTAVEGAAKGALNVQAHSVYNLNLFQLVAYIIVCIFILI
jgi:hypothetical protein